MSAQLDAAMNQAIADLNAVVTVAHTDAATAAQALAAAQASDTADKALVAQLTAVLKAKGFNPDGSPITVTPPPPPPTRSTKAIISTTIPGRVDLTGVGFTADLRRRDGGTPAVAGDTGWPAVATDGQIVGGPYPGSELTALRGGTTYVLGLHDAVKGDWVSVTVTMPPTAPPPPVITPPPATGGVRLAPRLLQGWFRWNDASAIPAFETAEGAPLDVFHLSVDGNDPQPVTLTTYGHCADWVKGGNRLLVMNWNWMTEAPGDFANGNIDAKAQAIAQFLVDLGISDKVIIRPGYEMNAFWMPWGDSTAGNYDGTNFKAMWQRVIPKMMAIAPKLRVTWCCNPGTPGATYDPNNPNGGSADPVLFFPGKYVTVNGKQVQIVHFIGIDQYFWWGTGNDWQGFLNTPRGIMWCAQFAQTQGLPWGIEETANADPAAGTQGGGDVPGNFTSLLNWCNAPSAGIPASYVLYEDVPDGGVGTTMEQLPQTAAAWGNYFKTHYTALTSQP